MTDDLVKRLRVCAAFDPDQAEAADRIEKDAQHIDEMYALIAAMNADHTASKTRIEKLEAALRSVLRYQLTDETWGMLGFDPKTIRAEFDAARNALEGKDD